MASRREFLQAGIAAALQTSAAVKPERPIKHVIVLMLENRSFDHMFAKSGIPGLEIPPDARPEMDNDQNVVPATAMGQTSGDKDGGGVDPDPDHDFQAVMYQMYGQTSYKKGKPPTMDHFVKSYQANLQHSLTGEPLPNPSADVVVNSRRIMACQPPVNIPVLLSLAQNYALFTRWHSSLPGPTLPNRLYAHLGTSCKHLDMNALDFVVPPTVYEVLNKDGVSATIYAGGWSVAATFDRLMNHQAQFFGTLDDFYQDCADNDLPGYCFIEPRYGSAVVNDVFLPQNDQHPDSDVSAGEELIYSVYQAIQSRKEVWESSVFIITYDEHGGLYDHCIPPEATPPGDGDSQDPPFDFTRYGVRVPAVVISPYTPRGIRVDDLCDHTSLIACARKLLTGSWDGSKYIFVPDDALCKRAMGANSLDKAFDFKQKRRLSGDTPIDFKPVKHTQKKPVTMNHLQRSHMELARSLAHDLNTKLPKHLQIKIPKKMETDQNVQDYVTQVYSRLTRGKTAKMGRPKA